jgi:hypothetical protein
MLTIYRRSSNGTGGQIIRPCPFISIAYNATRNKLGTLGGSYDITLTGTIIVDQGSPTISDVSQPPNGVSSFATSSVNPTGQLIGAQQRLGAILMKQHAIRELFSVDGQRCELASVDYNEPLIVFYPRVTSINFEEGNYFDLCRYTVNLQADLLFDKDDKIITDGLAGNNFENDAALTSDNLPTNDFEADSGRKTLDSHIDKYGGLVEDFSENWGIELEDGNGNTVDPSVGENIVRAYRLTRNVSATGKTTYGPSGRYEAWEQAKSFIAAKVLDLDTASPNGYSSYPKMTLQNMFSSGYLNLSSNVYQGYNHSRTESIDKSAGTYTLTDNWLLSSGTAFENYNMSLSSGIDTTIFKVSIDGTIKGLTSVPASGTIFGGNLGSTLNSAYENAIVKYRQVSNNGTYGPTSWIYKRAQNSIGIELNPSPLSVSLGVNEFNGEITYNVEFDTRPTNLISGVLSEQISIQDTYPGDVFAVIPVIGRPTGPVLQYIGGRTEYQRSIGIDIVVGQSYGGTKRQQLLLSKPILIEPMRSSINDLISQLSPAREPGIRKYFLSPPTESWDPKERRYTLNLNWTYELDR